MTDFAQPRSRRALLGAALGAVVATAATAIGRPLPTNATVTAMSTGTTNAADAITGLTSTSNTVLSVRPEGLAAPIGGVLQVATDSNIGLLVKAIGAGTFAAQVVHEGSNGIAIEVEAIATGGTGMQIDGDVIGINASAQTAAAGTGVSGSAFGVGSIGLDGYGATGVRGEGLLGGGIGVRGTATTGQGVRGEATSGVAGTFIATTGTALQVAGKAKFTRSGRATIAKNATYVDVTVAGGLAGSPLPMATLYTYRTGVYVAAVTPNATTGKIRIRLNRVASTTSSTYVSWFVIG